MGNIKRGEVSKTDLVIQWEKLKGRKATSVIYSMLKADLKREVDFLTKKKHERKNYRKALKNYE